MVKVKKGKNNNYSYSQQLTTQKRKLCTYNWKNVEFVVHLLTHVNGTGFSCTCFLHGQYNDAGYVYIKYDIHWSTTGGIHGNNYVREQITSTKQLLTAWHGRHNQYCAYNKVYYRILQKLLYSQVLYFTIFLYFDLFAGSKFTKL